MKIIDYLLVCSWIMSFIMALVTNEVALSEYGKKEKPLTKKFFIVLSFFILSTIISFILFMFNL